MAKEGVRRRKLRRDALRAFRTELSLADLQMAYSISSFTYRLKMDWLPDGQEGEEPKYLVEAETEHACRILERIAGAKVAKIHL